MNEAILLVVLGVAAGVLSGFVGIGGGVIIVPALVLFFGLNEHQAQGTTLALLVPPIGLAAAWVYYRQGYVDLKIAGLICAGFILGSIVGANFATGVSDLVLRRVFGASIIAIGLRMILFK
jgi:uncharacterized membrane protein YfcA